MCWCTLMLRSLLLSYFMVSAGKDDIMVNVNKLSWISMENFATMIKVSFDVSNCCNIFIAGESQGMENLFNEFVHVYPHEYVVRRRTYYCSGYFMISTSAAMLVKAMARVPTTISNTEILVVVDDDVKKDSLALFNVSMYANANVNIVAHNGMWKLSENFLKPRIFQSVKSHHEMVHNRGIVDLQGRELQAAAFFNPPLCYLWRTENRTVDGIEGEFFIAKNATELDGIEMKLFMLIADKLNFTWTIRKPNHNYRYGRANGTNWNGGMIGQLFRKEIDIAFTGIWLTIDHFRFSNMTRPWSMLSIHFLVPRPKPYTSFWALTRPLSPGVWSAVVGMLIFQSVYVYTRAWVNPGFRSFAITWTEMMGRLVGTWAPRIITGLELQFQLWHLIGVLVVTAYSSSLAASLASSGYEKRIDTLQDFIEANLTWGREGPVPKFSDFFDYNDPYARQFPPRFQHEENEVERHNKILKGNYAVVGRMVGANFFPENFIRREDLKGFRLMKQSAGNFYSSFIVQPWLLESVDKVMLWLRETGFTTYHLHDVLHRRTGSALREVLIEHDGNTNGARVLQLTPLGAGFFILILGLSLSTIIFYIELKSVSGQKPIRDVFVDIQKKREIWRIENLEKQGERKICKELNRKEYVLVLARNFGSESNLSETSTLTCKTELQNVISKSGKNPVRQLTINGNS